MSCVWNLGTSIGVRGWFSSNDNSPHSLSVARTHPIDLRMAPTSSRIRYCIRLCALWVLLPCGTGTVLGQGFLHSSGSKIIDPNGQEILLRGIGLGGWLVPEGYMLHMEGFANSPSEIRAKIASLVGNANADQFFQLYRNNYVAQKDIDRIAQWGFNSIRLPMHYALLTPKDQPDVYLESGFAIIDSLLSWCEADKIYLILDLHCAPGGQNNGNISDYSGYPSLWESAQNQQRTVDLWRRLAERYASKRWIGGYDLLNEPAWNLPPNNQPLLSLYVRITQAIRQVDQNHLIFAEGNWYATDFSGLTPPWDINMAYSFHKYWNLNNVSSINTLLNMRAIYNAPLWLGESGENSNAWFTDCVELVEKNNMGWSWWPHKKLASTSSPLSATITPEYNNLLKYWNGQGTAPTPDAAQTALNTIAMKLNIDSCVYHADVIDALIRQPFKTATIPFVANTIPGTIYAVNYDMGKYGYAYSDMDYQNTGGQGGGGWNLGGEYRNDGVDIERSTDAGGNGYDVGWINVGEFLNFTVTVETSDAYFIDTRIACSAGGGKIILNWDGKDLKSVVNVPFTGGLNQWQSVHVGPESLTVGVHNLAVIFAAGGFNLSSLTFTSTAVGPSGIVDVSQNYPNPFSPVTTVEYKIPHEGRVAFEIYDVLGRRVAALENGMETGGKHLLKLDARTLLLASGVYFYRVSLDGARSNAMKCVLLR